MQYKKPFEIILHVGRVTSLQAFVVFSQIPENLPYNKASLSASFYKLKDFHVCRSNLAINDRYSPFSDIVCI